MKPTRFFDGGTAFPVDGLTNGMSLRDYLAGQAVAGICAADSPDVWTSKYIAYHAYSIADAMIAARKDAMINACKPDAGV
jgi:hypothetical protein